MSAFTGDGNVDAVHGSHQSTVFHRHRAQGDFGRVMYTENGIYLGVFQAVEAHQLFGAQVYLLGRLEDELDAAVDVVSQSGQDSGRAQE